MPRVLDLSRNNCLKVKENKGKKLFFLSIFLAFGFWGGSISRADSKTGTD
jgi:hypothetical protein